MIGGGLVSFLIWGPKLPEQPDFNTKNLPPVAVRLIAPEKKEEAKKQLEKIKEKAEEKKPKEDVAEKPKPKKKEAPTPAVVEKPPESKALKALAKLTAAGPMKNDILAAVDKLGGGPGDKRIKTPTTNSPA